MSRPNLPIEPISRVGPVDALASRMVSNTAVQFVSPALRMLLGVVMVAALSRYLGPKGLGEYAVVFAYVLIFNGLFNDLGLGSTCLREISRSPDRRGEVLSSAIGLQLVVSAGTYGVLLLGLVFAHYPLSVTTACAVYGLTLFGTSVDLLALVFYAELKLARLLAPALLGSVISFGLTLASILLSASLVVLVLAAMAGVVVQYGWTFRRAQKAIGLLSGPSTRLWPELLRQALPLALNSVVTAIAQQGPLLILGFTSLAAAGIFNAAGKIPLQLLIVPMMVRTTTFPLLSEAWTTDRERFRRLLHHAIALSLLAAGPIAVGGVGLAGPLMHLLFGPGFAASVLPFQFLLMVSALLFPGILVGEALVASEHQMSNLVLSIATVPVLIVLLAAWAPGGGAAGAAAALLAYYAVQVGFTILVARRLLKGTAPVAALLTGGAIIAAGIVLAFMVEPHHTYMAVPLAALTLVILALLNRNTIALVLAALAPWSGNLSHLWPNKPAS